jgi:hypothetical protein
MSYRTRVQGTFLRAKPVRRSRTAAKPLASKASSCSASGALATKARRSTAVPARHIRSIARVAVMSVNGLPDTRTRSARCWPRYVLGRRGRTLRCRLAPNTVPRFGASVPASRVTLRRPVAARCPRPVSRAAFPGHAIPGHPRSTGVQASPSALLIPDRREPTCPRAVKRARHKNYRVKKPDEPASTHHHNSATIRIHTQLPRSMIDLSYVALGSDRSSAASLVGYGHSTSPAVGLFRRAIAWSTASARLRSRERNGWAQGSPHCWPIPLGATAVPTPCRAGSGRSRRVVR